MPFINEVATDRQQKISKSNLDLSSLNKRVEAQNSGLNAGLRAFSAACGQLNDNKNPDIHSDVNLGECPDFCFFI